ncbi:MAG: hypothetical protein A3B68_03740 [Candidatus Melainabacteria bacterium RIFCSPHIGHO2_02_FULL_34_12]|nr:MAG: hypothetical protein A3B68_03740 [Candidatus Melainabacteria bacterium RIFCSPHIGHO2_02_FULL_34_12]
MKIYKQIILTLLILIFSHGAVYGHDNYKTSDITQSALFSLSNIIAANPVLPLIPNRPPISDFINSDNSDQAPKPEIKKVKIKNLNSGNSNNRAQINHKNYKSNKPIAENYINELLFHINTQKLFGIALNLAKSLHMSVKSFDTNQGEIIIVDKYRNRLSLNIVDMNNNKSKIKIFVRKSLIGRNSFDRTVSEYFLKLTQLVNS